MALFNKKTPQDIAEIQRQNERAAVNQAFQKGITTLRDIIAPSSLEFHTGYFRVGTKYARTMYVYGYPRTIFTGWISPIINMDEVLDVSIFIYPVASEIILNNLRKKVTQLEATMQINAEHGRVRDPSSEAAYRDAEQLRDQLTTGQEKFFRLGLYVTIYAESLDELNFVQHKVETVFGQQMVLTKVASSQQEQGLNSTVPQQADQLQIRRNMNTSALSTSFPFTSADLTQDNGILYGVNLHNNGLVIFDRWSLENANLVVFAKSGAGKSFTVKLEALRTMMMGTEIIIVDPENEYQKLCEAVGGSYIKLSLNSETRINPFDLPTVIESDDNGMSSDALKSNLITLHGLFRQMLGNVQIADSGAAITTLTQEEEADLDDALIHTYARAGITSDPSTHTNPPPVIADLYDTLLHMGGSGPSLAQRLRKYTTGTFAGIFSQQSNVNINNPMVVFNIRDLEEELRPVAMYITLAHIWNVIRTRNTRRMLIVDEAWQLMKYEDAANFMFSIAKRARKYNLGLTTVTQDVGDFMNSNMGKAVVANASMHLFMKQATSAIDVLAELFKLTDNERKSLINFPRGRGLFFAGQSHVIIDVIASATETRLASSDIDKKLA
jgi:type IV secretory pathway VirB4 component